MSNPVLNKLAEPKRAPARPAPSPEHLQRMWNQPTYQAPVPATPPGNFPPIDGKGYGGSGGGGGDAPTRYMTLDDVVVRTGIMLAVVLVTGGLTWSLGPSSTSAGGLIGIGLIGGLGLGLYMAFTMKANAVTAILYSAFEGLLLGGVSRAFNDRYPGIVIQALTGTMLVAGGMLVVYRSGVIRVTPRFTRMVIGATIGALGLMVVNLVASFFVHGGLGLRDGGGMAILFSVVCIALAAFNLVLDFDMIEQSIKRGADQKFAWYASFGLMVTLIWLYIEMLRLIGYLRD
ncbi:MAG: Bax inhibitor-1/YccA family protein [Jatrophihabitans sp.]